MSYVVSGIFEDLEGKQFTCEVSLWEREWLPEPDNLIVSLKSKESYTEGPPEDSVSSSKSGGVSGSFPCLEL